MSHRSMQDSGSRVKIQTGPRSTSRLAPPHREGSEAVGTLPMYMSRRRLVAGLPASVVVVVTPPLCRALRCGWSRGATVLNSTAYHTWREIGLEAHIRL